MVRGGLRLKREVAERSPVKPSGPFTVAQLWVDSSVFHLDSTFSYLIPGDLAPSIDLGSMVLVPFHGRDLIATVVSLENPDSISGLKSIKKVLGDIPLLTPATIELIQSAAHRYAAHPFDLIRSAVPDRVVMIEKEFADEEPAAHIGKARGVQQYLQLPPHKPRSQLIAQKIASLDGGTLAVLPDSREVEALARELSQLGVEHVVIDSSLPKAIQYRNFLALRLGKASVALGTRSAIFAPIQGLKSILIYNEGSEHLYERRSPGWNARDIALLRRKIEKVDLYFVGYSPSTEVARLIDEEWIEFKKNRSKVRVQVSTPTHGELLPSRALSIVKEALKSGPVLFLAPLKGYSQAISCAKCRTISRCGCGGTHEKTSTTSLIRCNLCLTSFDPWKCSWCNHPVPSLASRGSDRHAHEIGLLLPNTRTLVSTSDHIITDSVDEGIVVATPGMAPPTTRGYSAVVILEGNRFLNQSDMRSTERVREMYFSHAALTAQSAPVILIQDEGNSIVTALASWNPSMAIHRDLQERLQLSLPPYVRVAHLTMANADVIRLKNALQLAINDGKLPASMKILGPIPAGEDSSLILSTSVDSGEQMIEMLHEFMKRRSSSKKILPKVRIDPYSLTP